MAIGDDGYFDVSPTDRSMAILDRTSPVAFHVIWDLVGPLDIDALTRAWQDLATAHPIIACSTDVEVDSRWRPGRELAPVRVVESGGNLDQQVAGELAVPMDLTKGPVVRLSAIKRTDGFRFILAAHHAALDGVSSVLLLEDLRRVYLDHVFNRAPSLTPDLSPRTAGTLMQQARLPLLTRQGVISRSLDRWRRLPPSTHVDPSADPSSVATDYVTIDMGPVLAEFDEQRRRNSWSVDAVLVGLLEAAWNETFGSDGNGAGVWLVARDLRPGLGAKRGIGNLSGTEAIAIRRPQVRPVDLVIEQAAAEMAVMRSSLPGLGPELLARSWAPRMITEQLPPAVLNRGTERMIVAGQRNRYTRTLSNLGRLPNSLIEWDPAHMEGIRFLGPLAKGPYTSFIAFAQGSSSWLTVRVSEDWLTRYHAMQLGAAIHRLSA